MYWQLVPSSFEGLTLASLTRFAKLVKFNGHGGDATPFWDRKRAFVQRRSKFRQRNWKIRRDIWVGG